MKMRLWSLQGLVILGFLLVNGCLMFGQTASTQVAGFVTDPAGASIPGAVVTATNVATGATRSTLTNTSGYYTIPFLLAGKYDVTVQKNGFQIGRQNGLVLQVEHVARVDFKLSVGAVTQTVTVSAQGNLLQSSTAELGTVVGEKEVLNLPLNGRNFTQLVTLSPGVTPLNVSQNGSGGTQGNSPFIFGSGATFASFNGQTGRSNTYQLDGITNDDQWLNNYVIPPIIDDIEEFKVSTHQDQAQFGGVLGGVINLVTKSGTNSLHGSAWEFMRNTDFDARNTFLAQRQVLRQNQYGVSIGGPFMLPKVYNGKNKSFFFFAWEGTRYTTPAEAFYNVPTAAELNGDLSAIPTQIYNPFSTRPDPNSLGSFTRSPFPNNQIPSNLINAGMVAYVKATMPSPTSTGVPSANAVDTTPTSQAMDSFTGRFDQNLGDKNTLFFRYSEEHLTTSTSAGRQGLVALNQAPGYQWVASYTRTFNPSLVMQAEVGRLVLHGNQPDTFTGLPANVTSEIGFAPSFVQNFGSIPTMVPAMNVPGYFQGGETVNNEAPSNVWQFKTIFNKVWGTHSLSFGGNYQTTGLAGFQGWPIESFSPEQTGNPESSAEPGSALASYLLGVPTAASHYFQSGTQRGGAYWDAFFQDSWKATPRLTLNLGLRYDKTQWPVLYENGSNAIGSWDLDTGNYMLQAMPPSCSSSKPPCIPGGTLPPHVYLSRDGKLIHDTPTNWGPRFAVAYRLGKGTALRGMFGIFYENQAGVNEGLNSDHGTWPQSPTSGQASNLNLPTTANPTPTVAALDPFPNGNAGGFPSPTGYYSDVSWFESPNMRTPYSEQWNLGVQHQFGDSTVLSVNYVGSGDHRVEVGTIYNTALTPGPGAIQPRQLFPYYTQAYYDRTIGNSNYNALQVTFDRHFTKGLTYLVSYTWAKAMDDGCTGLYGIEGCSIQDPYDIYKDRSVSAIDLTHMLSVSMVYDDPFGKGKRFSTGNPVLDYIIGNWQLSNIFTARSGQPYNLTVGSDIANTGVGFVRPNQVGDPNVANPTPARWFNTSAFVVPPLYTYGNVGRDSMRSAPFWELDTALFRVIPIHENMRLEFRVGAFNLLNNVVYGAADGNPLDPTFGEVLGTANNPRELQFGLKFVF